MNIVGSLTFTMVSNQIKYLGINVIKDVKGLCDKNLASTKSFPQVMHKRILRNYLESTQCYRSYRYFMLIKNVYFISVSALLGHITVLLLISVLF